MGLRSFPPPPSPQPLRPQAPFSARTKAVLEAAKARGTLLGSSRPGHWEGREERRAAGQKKATEKAAKLKKEKRLADVADLIDPEVSAGSLIEFDGWPIWLE